MANFSRRVPENVPGEFFVDATCIDCGVCRQLAPAIFSEANVYSFVSAQPRTAEETGRALRALLSCPTGSIGTRHRNDAKSVMADFPLPLEEGVFYCGFNSPKSYGGKSYFVQHPQGNWLIDSPKFLPQLVARLEEQGGISHIFLTHRDDVAEAEAYAQRFGAARIIHREDSAAQPNAEIVLKGVEPVQLAPEFLVIPTPGHTRGHCVLLYKSRFLFTGDHLWWNPSEQRLGASRDYCWYSWAKQTESMTRLLEFDFEWVLSGHGQWVHQPVSSLRKQLKALVDRMRASSGS